jgi:hypothetical protein
MVWGQASQYQRPTARSIKVGLEEGNSKATTKAKPDIKQLGLGLGLRARIVPNGHFHTIHKLII